MLRITGTIIFTTADADLFSTEFISQITQQALVPVTTHNKQWHHQQFVTGKLKIAKLV